MEWFRNMHEGHTGDGVGNNPMSFYTESVEYYTVNGKKTDSTVEASAPRNA